MFFFGEGGGIPSLCGTCNCMISQHRTRITLLLMLLLPLPPLLLLFHSDHLLSQERVLYERGDYTSWKRQYFMPGSSDAAVIALRKWLDSFGAALPTLPKSAADLPPLMPREEVMDRFKQHTEVCPHCSAAFRAATIAASLMAAVAAVAAGSIVAAVVGGSAPLVSPFTGAAAAVAAVAGLLAAAMLRFRQLFVFTDYVHAEH